MPNDAAAVSDSCSRTDRSSSRSESRARAVWRRVSASARIKLSYTSETIPLDTKV